MVIGPSTPWQLIMIQGVHRLITRVILMMIDAVMHGQGQVTWRTTRFLLIKLFYRSFCISTCLDYDHPEHYGANAQNTYRRIHKSHCSRPIDTKRCYWAVILDRIESWNCTYSMQSIEQQYYRETEEQTLMVQTACEERHHVGFTWFQGT